MNSTVVVSVNKNLVANFLGQGWVGLVGLVFLPVYIHYLGIEAFGLIGVFGILQSWLALLDMGMSPTLNREMARFSAGAHSIQTAHDLLRSLELVAMTIAISAGLLIWGSSGWLASEWLLPEKLSREVVQHAVALMGIVIAFRFLEGIYRGALTGLQHQVLLNVVNAAIATLRAVGAIGVLAWLSPTIEAYFLWQGAVSAFAVAVLAVTAHGRLPKAPRSPSLSWEALKGVWRFAAGMFTTTFLALLLTQVDKILLSRLLSLEHFGYYTLAGTVATAIILLVTPVTQAYFPRFSELVVRGDISELFISFHRGARLVTALATPGALLLIIFGENLVAAWTADKALAAQVAPILALLAAGTLLNGLMHIPYMLQLSYGWSSLAVKMNLVAVVVLTPAIIWLTPRYGPSGAAWILVLLNIAYVMIGARAMFRRIAIGELRTWYVRDVLFPMIVAIVPMAVGWLILQHVTVAVVVQLGAIFTVCAISWVSALLLPRMLDPK